jgi:hypothetical protein
MTDATDVTSTLADLERKLRELERELTSIGRRGEPADAPLAPSDSPAPAQEIGGRLVDEAIEPQGRAESPVRPSERWEPPSVPPPRSGEPLQPTDEQLAGLAELRRFRDRLERFARELADEYDALLSRVMTGLFSVSPPPPGSPRSVGAQAQETFATQTPPPPPPVTSAAPPPPPPAPPPPPPTVRPEAREERLFEGHVELGVGPFYDIDSLSAFERRLAGLPNAIDASVRRFEASHAVIDLRLAAPVALVSELRRTLDTDFNVRQVADGRILLTFDEP